MLAFLTSPCIVVSDLPAEAERLRACGFQVDQLVELFYDPTVPIAEVRQPAVARWLLGLPAGWRLASCPRKDGSIDIVMMYDAAGRQRGSWEPGPLKAGLLRRYSTQQQHLLRSDIMGRAHVFDEATQEVSWVSDEGPDGGPDDDYFSYSKRLALRAEEWLDQSQPGWRDPTTGW